MMFGDGPKFGSHPTKECGHHAYKGTTIRQSVPAAVSSLNALIRNNSG